MYFSFFLFKKLNKIIFLRASKLKYTFPTKISRAHQLNRSRKFMQKTDPHKATFFCGGQRKRLCMGAKKPNWLQVAFWHFVEFQLGCRFWDRGTAGVSGKVHWGTVWGLKSERRMGQRAEDSQVADHANETQRDAFFPFFSGKLEKQLPALRAAKLQLWSAKGWPHKKFSKRLLFTRCISQLGSDGVKSSPCFCLSL